MQFIFPSWELSKYIERCRPLAFIPYYAYLKKKRPGSSFPTHFPHSFWRKIFLFLYSIIWPSFIAWLILLREILGNVFCNCFLTMLWRHEFWYWQMETQLFTSSYIWLAYIFKASYSTMMISVSKKSSVDQSEFKK